MPENDGTNDGQLSFGREKREYPRVVMNAPVRYRVLGKEEGEHALGRFADKSDLLEDYEESETANVSRKGTAIYTNQEIPERSIMAVNINISIPGIAANCRALAEVLRREKSDNPKYLYVVAVKFLTITHHNLKNYKFKELKELLDLKDPLA